MKKKTLFFSVVSAALCFCLLVGSTYALFTSEVRGNIAMTSATVDVSADVAEDTLVTTSFDVVQPYGLFELGGTATFDGAANLTLTNMAPGDAVEFNIQVKNNSNIAVKYRVKWAIEGSLADSGVLVATADGVAISDDTDAWTTWTKPATDADRVRDIEVRIELPESADNVYQDKSAKITLIVEAVQGNAIFDDVSSYEDVVELLDGAEAGNWIEMTLVGDITSDPANTVSVPAGVTIVIYVKSFEFAATIENDGTVIVVGADEGSLDIVGGSVTYN